jgi:glutathione S-transferase
MTIVLYELVGIEDRRFSPYCWRTRMALEHKGLAYETVPVRFTDKPIIAFSGQERVPVIRDGEKVVSDSWAIATYLEDTYPDTPALFGCAAGRGLAKFLNVWTDRALHGTLIRLVIADILDHADPADRDYFIESRTKRFGASPAEVQTRSDADRKAFSAAIATIGAALEGQDFLSGDAPAYGDYIVFGAFAWARAISPFALVDRGDPVFAWRERMLDLFGGHARRASGYPV